MSARRLGRRGSSAPSGASRVVLIVGWAVIAGLVGRHRRQLIAWGQAGALRRPRRPDASHLPAGVAHRHPGPGGAAGGGAGRRRCGHGGNPGRARGPRALRRHPGATGSAKGPSPSASSTPMCTTPTRPWRATPGRSSRDHPDLVTLEEASPPDVDQLAARGAFGHLPRTSSGKAPSAPLDRHRQPVPAGPEPVVLRRRAALSGPDHPRAARTPAGPVGRPHHRPHRTGGACLERRARRHRAPPAGAAAASPLDAG